MNEPMMTLKRDEGGRQQRLFAISGARLPSDRIVREREPSLGWALLGRLSPAER